MFRNAYARPWPESGPRQPGERCDLSDLLIDQCACKKHAKEENDDNRAEPLDLDFG